MDLPLILSEFETFYEMKFDKKPKLVRKLANGEERVPTRPRPPEGDFNFVECLTNQIRRK
jgi:hypothetical protein